MNTHNSTVRRTWVIVLLVSLAATAFAGLREVPPSRSQTATSGGLSGVKGSSGEVLNSNAGGKAHPLPEMLGGGATIPQHLRTGIITNNVPGEIVVKLRQNSQAATVMDRAHKVNRANAKAMALTATNDLAGVNELSETNELSVLLKKHHVSSARTHFSRAKRETGAGGAKAKTAQEIQRDGLFRWCRLQLPKDADLNQVLTDFKANPAVEYAEAVIEYRLAADAPNATTDPWIGDQWHLTRIKAQQTWNYFQTKGLPMGGNRDVVVAVIDSGVDYNHEDLVGNMWTNPGEISGNGRDDDGNGFVDDIHGCSVVSDARSHSGDPMDQNGHGTHVAGIIAATAYNHKGGVGVAFNVQIMAVRAAQSSGKLTTTDIAEGILYAVDNGAEVINMSFGDYHTSQIIEDALAVAFNQAVLVAAAGNGINGTGVSKRYMPFYPAALPYVLGVMSTTRDGKYATSSNHGYDIAPPGEGILSTWPGNRYSIQSGTSMAAPVASGIAALLRSCWWQRDLYSSRYIMGQLRSGVTYASLAPGTPPVSDAFKGATVRAAPGVELLENWLFDARDISARNDADGRIDSGETINLGIEVRNISGLASNVVATLRAVTYIGEEVVYDPYVTFVTNTVQFGNIGSFATADNGFIRNLNGIVTGVARPFVFQVASNCPNDHVIPFEITFAYRDGWNPDKTELIINSTTFSYVVQRGKNVPRVIETDTLLTANDFWIVGSPVMVVEGATLTIGPGTQVQWGSISDDPYNPGPQTGSILVFGNLRIQGTRDQPVSMFPSYLVGGQGVGIQVYEGGTADISYAKVRAAGLGGFRIVDHCYFDADLGGGGGVSAQQIKNTIFHRLQGGGISASLYDTCLFDSIWMNPGGPNGGLPRIVNCTFLPDNENNRAYTITPPPYIDKSYAGKTPLGGIYQNYDPPTTNSWCGMYHAVTRNGFTYVSLPAESTSQFQQAEMVAQSFGGHITSIADQAEQTFLENYLSEPNGVYWSPSAPGMYLIGLTDEGTPGNYYWLDGSPLGYVNWESGFPTLPGPLGVKSLVALQKMECGIPNGVVWLGPWRNVSGFGAGRENSLYWFGPAFILKLPGTWTAEQLNAQVANGNVLRFVRPRMRGEIIYNAILSKYWDMKNTWTQIRTAGGNYASMNFNYWGTTSTNLIDVAILDYEDAFGYAHVDYAPPAAHGYASTFPFVEQVLINGISAESQPKLGAGRTDFRVTFNRDMNTNIEPFVAFGPGTPYTDFLVAARDADFRPITNGWLNARTWQGAAQLSQFTGEGYQMTRISGAVAADDPWLVSGYDVARFRFSVKTMGVQSMTLQALGQEGSIQLSWQQNDYELLAGYNLYRADGTNGPWTRLNDIVIPPGSESYSDTNVAPAVPKFYQFTVVTTDMTESEPSNLAMASALDTLPPVLIHTPVTSALPARGVRLSATATDNLRVTGVTLFYRLSGSASDYTGMAMINVTGNDWSATIPGSAVQSPGVDYYITATDGISEVFSGTPILPHVVQVSNVPTLASVTPNHGSSAGGTAVALSGTLFEPEASVLFGGVLASNITLVSGNQLTCVTPPHFPALVDVTVVNTNGTQSTLLSAFQFEQTGVVVALPVTNGNYGTQVELGLAAANVAGLRAVDVTITFDATVLSAVSARVGTLTAGWALSANLNTPGRAVLSLANGSSVAGSGSLALLRFNVVKAPPASTALAIQSVSLNDGAMAATRSDGSFTVNGFFALAGTVRYFGGSELVPDTTLDLAGAGAFHVGSATNGGFSITNIPTGSYVLTPTKTNQVAEITAYDASLVLQAAAGLLSLSSSQIVAADVNRNGIVSAMDASYILEKAVGLIEGPFPGAGRLWDFTPGQRSYSLLNSDLAGQDFTAVLIGDVSGNWTAAAGSGGVLLPPAGKQSTGEASKSMSSVVIGTDNGPVPGAAGEKTGRVLLGASEAPVYGIDLILSYVPTNRAVAEVRRGGLAQGMALAANTTRAGVVRASLAGAAPLSGTGSLLTMSFAGSDPVTWQIDQVRVNEGQVSVVRDTTLATFDTDGDGLMDVDELELFHTDPARRDTDGDGMPDGAEVRAGSDPLDKNDVFRVAQADPVDGLPCVAWTGKSNRTYQVIKSLDLRLWTNAPNGVGVDQQSRRTAVTNGTLYYLDAATPGSGAGEAFYRVRLVE